MAKKKPCEVVGKELPCLNSQTGRCLGRPYWEGRSDSSGATWKEVKAHDLSVCPWHDRIRQWWVKKEQRKRREAKPLEVVVDMTNVPQKRAEAMISKIKEIFEVEDD